MEMTNCFKKLRFVDCIEIWRQIAQLGCRKALRVKGSRLAA